MRWNMAWYNPGSPYHAVHGMRKNPEAAPLWFKLSAEAGDPRARLNLGLPLDAMAKARKDAVK